MMIWKPASYLCVCQCEALVAAEGPQLLRADVDAVQIFQMAGMLRL